MGSNKLKIFNQQYKDFTPVKQKQRSPQKQWRLDWDDPMQKKLKEIGLEIKQVKQDGNSLFRAVSDQTLGVEKSHLMFRAMACECMDKYEKFFQMHIPKESLFSYLNKMKEEGQEGTCLELLALALDLRINVCLYEDKNYQEPVCLIEHFYNEPFIFISQHNKGNFNSIRIIGDKGDNLIDSLEVINRIKMISQSYNIQNKEFYEAIQQKNHVKHEDVYRVQESQYQQESRIQREHRQIIDFQKKETDRLKTNQILGNFEFQQTDLIYQTNYKNNQDASNVSQHDIEDQKKQETNQLVGEHKHQEMEEFNKHDLAQSQTKKQKQTERNFEKDIVTNETYVQSSEHDEDVLNQAKNIVEQNKNQQKKNLKQIFNFKQNENNSWQEKPSQVLLDRPQMKFNIVRASKPEPHVYVKPIPGKPIQEKTKKKKKWFWPLDWGTPMWDPFEKQLAELGLKIKYMPGDGNCLFHAIGDQLWGGMANHKQTRRHILDYVERNQEKFEDFVIGKSFKKYVSDKRQGAWGGEIELWAASEIYKVNICVFKNDLPPRLIGNFPCERNNTIYISYHGGVHYNSIRRTNDLGFGRPLPLPIQALRIENIQHENVQTKSDDEKQGMDRAKYNVKRIDSQLQKELDQVRKDIQENRKRKLEEQFKKDSSFGEEQTQHIEEKQISNNEVEQEEQSIAIQSWKQPLVSQNIPTEIGINQNFEEISKDSFSQKEIIYQPGYSVYFAFYCFYYFLICYSCLEALQKIRPEFYFRYFSLFVNIYGQHEQLLIPNILGSELTNNQEKIVGCEKFHFKGELSNVPQQYSDIDTSLKEQVQYIWKKNLEKDSNIIKKDQHTNIQQCGSYKQDNLSQVYLDQTFSI